MVLLPLGLVILAGLTVWRLVLTQPAPPLYEFRGATMGTMYAVKIDAPLTPAERAAIADTIKGRLAEVNRLMSTYDSASELSRFNRHESTTPFAVSPLLLEVVGIAQKISERSEGAFDVTVAPLVDAWGFGPAGRPSAAPTESELHSLKTRVGYRQVTADSEAGMLVKRNPKTVLDLSAVAKGYGVDRVADALMQLGASSFLVEVGGELRAGSGKRDGTPWRVGIERPDTALRSVYRPINLVNQGVATSGDYRNFYVLDGVRYAHIIDPRTGRPIPWVGFSVTVVHPKAAVADAWATALTVLGPDRGYAVAEREGIAALFVVPSEGGFTSRETAAFQQPRLGDTLAMERH